MSGLCLDCLNLVEMIFYIGLDSLRGLCLVYACAYEFLLDCLVSV